MVCKNCHEFDHQSKLIDQSLIEFLQNEDLKSEEIISEEKIFQLENSVNQNIK